MPKPCSFFRLQIWALGFDYDADVVGEFGSRVRPDGRICAGLKRSELSIEYMF